MDHEKKHTIQMQGGEEKEPENSPPPRQEPDRRKDESTYTPEPLTETPRPDQIEPTEGWDRE